MTATGVIIIGGGFCGAATAYHLADRAAGPLTISVVEPRPQLGSGLAYSAAATEHRINVPAVRMTLLPDQPDHFAQWLHGPGAVALADDPAAQWDDERVFPSRRWFGAYVAETLASLAARPAPAPVIRHHQTRAVAARPLADGWQVTLEDGSQLTAAIVVLATSHPPPAVPADLAAQFGDDPRLISNPWDQNALDGITADEDVVIIGTGLTMADVVASLEARGHRGRITAFSRRGLLSRGHPTGVVEPFGDYLADQPTSALALLRRVRAAVKAAAAAGQPWQAVIDAVRRDGQALWQGLTVAEQRKLVRHLRPFWDVHRYRIAPQAEAAIARLRASGRFVSLAGSLIAVERSERLHLTLRPRWRQERQRLSADRLVLTTGPGHGDLLTHNPLLADLAAQGLATIDPCGLGLAVDRQSRLLDQQGRPQAHLRVAGPLARGTFGELMGLPQVTHHARDVAWAIAEALNKGR